MVRLLQILALIATLLRPSSSQDDIAKFNELFTKLLVIRDPGTPGNLAVQQVIKAELQSLGFEIATDNFTDSTPRGQKPFSNIIGSSLPKACDRLVLACHFDSKQQAGFLAATDSAAPCAMLLTMARALRTRPGNSSVSLDLIFFDGEEAFVRFTDRDGLYGSRHLAAKWDTDPAEPSNCRSVRTSRLRQIKMFVLLDLLGAAGPTFYNQYPSMSNVEYSQLSDIRETLRAQGLITGAANYFRRGSQGNILDDHKPFFERNVPIVHLIPIPFPSVWHRNSDNGNAIDVDTTMNLLRIVREFARNYLACSGNTVSPTTDSSTVSPTERTSSQQTSSRTSTRQATPSEGCTTRRTPQNSARDVVPSVATVVTLCLLLLTIFAM